MRLICLLTALGCAPAFADCVDGTRAVTEAERTYYDQTMRRLQAAVPAAPPGWQLENKPVYPLGNSTCKGSAFSRVALQVSYANLELIQASRERSEQSRKEIAELRKLPGDKQAEMNELSKQSRLLQRERPKLRTAGDKDGLQALETRIQELDRQWAAIRRAHEASVLPRIQEISAKYLAAEEGRNYKVRFTVTVNDPSPAGAAMAVGQAAGPGVLQIGSVTLRVDGEPALAAQITKLWNLEPVRTRS